MIMFKIFRDITTQGVANKVERFINEQRIVVVAMTSAATTIHDMPYHQTTVYYMKNEYIDNAKNNLCNQTKIDKILELVEKEIKRKENANYSAGMSGNQHANYYDCEFEKTIKSIIKIS